MDDMAFYDMYKKELELVMPCDELEEAKLITELLNGEMGAKSRLIEGNLDKVIAIAERYVNQGVSIADLVAEGNVALALAVDSYKGGIFSDYIEEKIESAVKAALFEQDSSDKAGEELAAKLNILTETTTRMAEELGREATADEVAKVLKMEEEEVKALMKMALDAISQ